MRRISLVFLVAVAAIVPAQAQAARHRGSDVIPGRYIVVLKSSVKSVGAKTGQLEKRGGFKSKFRYRHALKGFAARLSTRQVRRLKRDPAVAAVVPDRRVRALDTLAAGDTAPAGVRRIGGVAGTNVRGPGARVAVIDTGIDLAQSDLNAVNGTNCVNPGSAAQDDHGHGTHVAGTIAARNDGAGVVGVAAGTQVVAVKVLNSAGSGTTSQVVCGIDWVTGTRNDSDPSNDVAVANMSLGGGGDPVTTCPALSDPEHRAICDSTAAGVIYAVAAGNSGWDFDYGPAPDVPAAYPEAVTVAAMGDTDGVSGGVGGAPSCRSGEADDRYASFSNYAATAAGRAHTLAAPGVCVSSDRRGGGTTTMSGTSMATPHVAGTLALCVADGTCAGVAANNAPGLVARISRTDSAYGYTGDPLHSPTSGRYFGYLAWAGAPGTAPPPPPPMTSVSAAPGGTVIQTGTLRSGNAAALAADDASFYRVNSTTRGTRTTAWYGSFGGVPSTLTNLSVTYKGANSVTCSQTVAIYRWTTGAWVTLDTRNVGTGQVSITRNPTGNLADYRSASGELRVRIRCTRSSSFYSSGNLLRIAYDKPA